MQLGGILWAEESDHSKWVLGADAACFGDMNRMPSQWKRGGSFYCLTDRTLIAAMKSLIVETDSCVSRGHLTVHEE